MCLFVVAGCVAEMRRSPWDVGAAVPPLALHDHTVKDNVTEQLSLGRFECGRRLPAYANKIVGGEAAGEGEYPWTVSLQAYPDWRPQHVCGGALLTARWAATAAHCLEDLPPSQLAVVAGARDLLQPAVGWRQTRRLQLVVTRAFDPANFARDLALLQLDRPFELGPRVQPVCLPAQGRRFYGRATVAGWGRLREEGLPTRALRSVSLPLVEEAVCRRAYERLDYARYLTGCQMCAGLSAGGRDACQGDSGGPLVCEDPHGSGRHFLCGLVSWGIGCARPNMPGVYTQISCYSDWIRSVIFNENNILGL